MKPEQVDAIVANFIKNADATLDSPASPLLLIGLAETQAEIFEATSRLRQNAAGGKVHPDLYAWCINEILVRGLDHDAHDPQAN
ncbi:MAG: hypothetical protein H7A48_04160 [Akkermansiaceae bacterium]|nr:hypothetical protein [Akkermansiaceae bacterium]MCP5547588.1 hypothetical protein [Akkermansiaceae bacterium]